MSTPPHATTRPLERLVDLLGARPDPGRSDGWYWRLVVAGAVMFAVNVLPGAEWVSSASDQYARLLALCVGLTLASWGASGLLLRRGSEALSVWLSIFQAVNFFPMTALLFLAIREWLGLPWAVGLAVAACAFHAVVRKRSRQYGHADGTGA